jgi:hypothetical protein
MMETHPGKKMASKKKKQQTNMNPKAAPNPKNPNEKKPKKNPQNKRQPNR